MAENDVFKYPPTPGTVLPPGAATEAKQDVMIQELQDIEAKVSTEAKQDTIISELGDIKADADSIANSVASLDSKTTKVDTDDVTVTSSVLPPGAATETTLSALNTKVTACDTGAVVVSSSALPTGAATEATLSTLNGKVTACDTGAVTVAASALPTGAATEATLSTLNGKVTAVDTGNVTVASSALPTGAATETTLASIDTKTPALGQAAMAASVPVAIASNQSAIPVLVNSSLVPFAYDAIDADLSGATTDVYEYYTGGLVGTLVATVTLTYTDSSKATLQSVVRT